jgi:hypothetical protein
MFDLLIGLVDLVDLVDWWSGGLVDWLVDLWMG